MVHYKPDGFHTITPYLLIKNAAQFIEFLKQAFDAQEICCMKQPSGEVMHAEVKIGDSIIMMGEPKPEDPAFPASLYLYLEDTDKTYQKALNAGATSIMPPADQFYGVRNAGVKDQFGNQWWIATRIEELSEEEIERRAANYLQKCER